MRLLADELSFPYQLLCLKTKKEENANKPNARDCLVFAMTSLKDKLIDKGLCLHFVVVQLKFKKEEK